MSPRHLAIVGPTATGKSALALALARADRDVEIVSLDSMQVYRGMDVGTAKPSVAERREVRHHCIDVADPSENWSVVRTQRAARAAIADIEDRGRRAVLVGGTGLYVNAVVDEIDVPGEDLDVRDALLARTAEPEGLRSAYAELSERDPLAASRIDERNRRRVVRALEVIEISGRPFSSFGGGVFGARDPALSVAMVGLWRSRADLGRRIGCRVRRMLDAGLLDEVRSLASVDLSHTAAQAIGYAEMRDHLRCGGPDLDAAVELTVRRTLRLARRQRMWFRRDERVVWFGVAEDAQVDVDAVRRHWSSATSRVRVSR